MNGLGIESILNRVPYSVYSESGILQAALTSDRDEAVLPVAYDAVQYGIQLAVVGKSPRVLSEGSASILRAGD